MYCVVVKPFLAYGEPYTTGMLVDSSGLGGKEAALIRTRYLREATPAEVMEAEGVKPSRSSNVPKPGVKPSPRTKVAPPPVADEEEEETDDEEEEDTPPARPPVRVSRRSKSTR
jgi:hypothetical protein